MTAHKLLQTSLASASLTFACARLRRDGVDAVPFADDALPAPRFLGLLVLAFPRHRSRFLVALKGFLLHPFFTPPIMLERVSN